MKNLVGCLLACMCVFTVNAQKTKVADTSLLQPVEVTAIRASDKTPVAKTNLSKSDIEKNNIGQDLPFILNRTASTVVNADAGNGFGYTGIRIRGTDASRINTTLNGIPYNDAESQGTYYVDLPDIASSANNIQIQRGVGTSTNGAGSFGGTINIKTNELNTKPSLEFNNSAGSYRSFKHTLILNSGLFAKHFTLDARLSSIRSDGYIDRASSHLRSFYTSAAYTDTKNSLRFTVFSGKEKTYQAWNGIDENTLAINPRYNSAGTEKAGDPYWNETDNYVQTHYQLFFNHKFNKNWKGNAAIFLTKGKGYYEQYKANQLLSDYGLPDYSDGTNIITSTNLIRRLWLDNNFYGSIFSLQYEHAHTNVIIGGGWTSYDGKHYGEIIQAEVQAAVPQNYRWYNLTAFKKDYSIYAKWTEQLALHWQTFIDIQGRYVDYTINGFEANPLLQLNNHYFFINPKAGITYSNNNFQAYISYARAAKEPNRDDFEAGKTQQPKPEILNDIEAGIEHKSKNGSWSISIFYMGYTDQLVLTGKINDVGAYTRTNIPKSSRTGIEFQAARKINKWLSVDGNIAFSENRIKNYTEYLDDYDNGGQQTKFYAHSTIAFSPATVAAASVNFTPVKNSEVSLLGKYVSRQYLDNTAQYSRSLPDYYVQDIRLSYTFEKRPVRSAKLFIQAMNIFSKKYQPNGYSFSYISGGTLTTENYYFPMAPANWIIGLNIKL